MYLCSTGPPLLPNAVGAPTGEVSDATNAAFGSFEKMKEEFGKAAATRFGDDTYHQRYQ